MFIDQLARAALAFLAFIWIAQGLQEHRHDQRLKRWHEEHPDEWFSDPPPDWTPPPRPSAAYSIGHRIGMGLMAMADMPLQWWCAHFHRGSHSPHGHCVRCGRRCGRATA